MKFRWLLFFLLGLPAVAQPHGPPAMATSFVQYMSGPAACQVAAVYFDQTQHKPYYCYPANTWVAFGGSSSGVTQLIAGTNITLDPSGGTGAVTINATGGGSGPVQTCDASTLAAYAYGVCVKTLNAAQLLSWDGTIGTAISIIDAPGSGLMIQPSSIAVQYEAGSHPFSASAGLSGAYGSNELGLNDFAVDFTQSANRLSNQIGGFGLLNADPTGVTAVPFGLFAANVINQGAIASSTVDAGGHGYTNGDTGTISGGNATYAVTSVSAGNGAIVAVNPTPDAAGLGYAVNDTGVLTHGSGTAAYVVDSVGTTGAILTNTIDVPGTLYSVGDVVQVTGAGNADAFGVVTAVGAGGSVTTVAFPSTGTPTSYILDGGLGPSGGSGYSAPASNIVTITGPSGVAQVGAVSGVSVGTSGSGYAIGDVGHISGGGDGTAQYIVTSIGIGGSVTSVNLRWASSITLGSGYSIASGLATAVSSGSGDGNLTLNVTAINTGGGDGNLTLDITAINVGVVTFHLSSNGTGYSIESNSPTATGGSQPGTGTGFEVNITDVNAGIVTGFSVTDTAPDTYSVATGVGTAITSGSGDGTFTINIPTITQGNGDAVVTIDYQNVTVH